MVAVFQVEEADVTNLFIGIIQKWTHHFSIMYYGLKHKQDHSIFCLWKGRMAKNLQLPLATNYLYSSYFLNALTLSHDTPKSHSIMPSNSSLGNYQPKLVQMRSELFSCSSLGLIPSIWFFMTWKFHKIKLSPFHIQHAIIRIGYKTLIALPIKKKKKGGEQRWPYSYYCGDV